MSTPIMALDDEALDELPPQEASPTSSRRTILLIVVLAVVAFGVGFLAYTFFMKSDEPQAAQQVARTPGGVAAPVVAKPSPAPSIKAYAGQTGRDPFKPLPTPAPPKPVEAKTPILAAPPPVAPTPTAPASGSSGNGPTVTLKKIGVSGATSVATVAVNGKPYNVVPGQSFAKSFKVYEIFNENCIGLLYGDQNVAMCLGDSQKM